MSSLPPPRSSRSLPNAKEASQGRTVKRAVLSRTKLIGMGLAALLLVSGSLYGLFAAERYLIRSPRFVVKGSEAGAGATLKIIGAEHASLRAIETVFAADLGRSLYLVPIQQRLATLQDVHWVRDASVARVWPNSLLIQVSERTPVAFLTTSSGKVEMIDGDGVILPRVKGAFSLPVLAGIRESDGLERRRDGVLRMLQATAELGSAMQFISEIDVSDPENVIVSQSGGGGILRLMLGDRNFDKRYQNFVKNYDQIMSHAPDANVLDLRLEDRVIAAEN